MTSFERMFTIISARKPHSKDWRPVLFTGSIFQADKRAYLFVQNTLFNLRSMKEGSFLFIPKNITFLSKMKEQGQKLRDKLWLTDY